MNRRALVLGGGGTVGIAWEMGLAAGMLAEGVDLRLSDLIVGTSAGSVVGTQLAAGFDPSLVLELARHAAQAHAQPARTPVLDMTNANLIFTKWTSAGEMTAEVRREIGGLALATKTVPEAEYMTLFTQLLGVEDWPERRLLMTAVDAHTGDFVVWSKESGAPLLRAVASSCAVPGLFPPVTIKESRYVDGGVRSGTNADLAEGHEAVVIIAPLGQLQLGAGRHSLEREMARLQAGGSRVELIQPDAASLDAFGGDMMDPSKVVPAGEAGLHQGKALAARVRELWG